MNTPVTPVDTNIVWEDCQNIVELDIHVATSTVISRPQVDVITFHYVELKCSHYSYVTIARHPVKIKQDTGAEVNVMPKCVFIRLSNGAMRNTALLNKARTTEIMGYGQNPINYIGTCVFHVKHNNINVMYCSS